VVNLQEIHVSWRPILGGQAWSIHVFPHRTFTISGLPIIKEQLPFIAVACSMNVLLGQDNEMHVNVYSEKPLPLSFVPLCNLIKKVSDGKFNIKLANTTSLYWPQNSDKSILLDSGGKDSRYLVEELNVDEIMFIKGATIAGEYRTELDNVLSRHQRERVNIVEFDSWDYTSIGLQFKYRSRWKAFVSIILAATLGDNICIGINHDLRLIDGNKLPDGDLLRYFPDSPVTLSLLAKILRVDIVISPPESYCYFRSVKMKWNTRSCFSPDLLCDPNNDFLHSCGKCKTLLIYDKISKNTELTKNENEFFTGDEWMGDSTSEIIKNYGMRDIIIPPIIISGK
jgi:hypothetical protein